MANCTFFGHRDCPETIRLKLREALMDLIVNHNVNMFYVGNQGQFDAYVHSELKKIKQEYPQINYAVVLAYMPGKKTEYDDYPDTMLPEGIESVHPHYAISWRNNWMLKTIRLRRHLHYPLLRRRISARRKSQAPKESCGQSIKTS